MRTVYRFFLFSLSPARVRSALGFTRCNHRLRHGKTERGKRARQKKNTRNENKIFIKQQRRWPEKQVRRRQKGTNEHAHVAAQFPQHTRKSTSNVRQQLENRDSVYAHKRIRRTNKIKGKRP